MSTERTKGRQYRDDSGVGHRCLSSHWTRRPELASEHPNQKVKVAGQQVLGRDEPFLLGVHGLLSG